MKTLTFIFSALLMTASFATSGSSELLELLKIQHSTNVSQKARAEGFDIKRVNKPFIKNKYKNLKDFLSENEKKQQELFNQVVDSGEYDYVVKNKKLTTQKKRELIKKNAKKYLDVKYLFEIGRTFKVTKNGELIGYIFDIAEHGQAAVYQDGAWSEVYVDKDFELVYRDQQSS